MPQPKRLPLHHRVEERAGERKKESRAGFFAACEQLQPLYYRCLCASCASWRLCLRDRVSRQYCGFLGKGLCSLRLLLWKNFAPSFNPNTEIRLTGGNRGNGVERDYAWPGPARECSRPNVPTYSGSVGSACSCSASVPVLGEKKLRVSVPANFSFLFLLGLPPNAVVLR